MFTGLIFKNIDLFFPLSPFIFCEIKYKINFGKKNADVFMNLFDHIVIKLNDGVNEIICIVLYLNVFIPYLYGLQHDTNRSGGLAQMVERSLSM